SPSHSLGLHSGIAYKMELSKKQKIARHFASVLAILLVAFIYAVIFPSFNPNSNDYYFALAIYLLILLIPLVCIFQTRFRPVKLLGWILICFMFSIILILG
ncbi:hypothetical protein, partial [Pseudoalteromonas phenolica]|uniref:hypothetical protein n=1 Tax=Pseudoalteromonas phenolica TaxID=161398 RepID=UPI001BB207B8